MESSLVSSWYPLWLDLLGCSLPSIDVAGDSLSSRSSSIGCRFNCYFEDLFLLSPPVLCTSNGCLFPLCTIPPSSSILSISSVLNCWNSILLFVFFRVFPRSIVESVLCSGSFMCASQFCSASLFVLSTLSASLSFAPKRILPQPSLTFIVLLFKV